MAIITISRGSFSGGRTIAELLSQRLGHPCLSREAVLAQASKDYGISEATLAQALNESPHFWQQVSGTRLAYVKCLTAVLLEHASRGNLIYHGYVGHLLLAGISHVLRIRAVADMPYRVQAAARHAKMNVDDAPAYIRRVDEERSRWARLLYGVDWTDPTQYSAVLNLSHLSVTSACDTIVQMSQLPEFKPTVESQKCFDDLRLSCQVWAALARNADTRSAGIHVTSDGGNVVITGNVGSTKVLELIPRLAGAVEGVKTVRCDAGMGSDWFW